MADLNYFNAVVRILEMPKEKILKQKFSVFKCRVQLPQPKGKRVVVLNAWGQFTKDRLKNYAVNDYILVEGYLSLKTPLKKKLSSNPLKVSKRIHINAIKIYPYILNNRSEFKSLN